MRADDDRTDSVDGMTVVPFKQRDLFTRRWRQAVRPVAKEIELHIQLVSMLRWCIRPDVFWRHVPNGEHRDPRTAAKLKAMGVMPGSADLEFFWRDAEKNFRALFLELKRPGGKLTTEQAAFGLMMRIFGADFEVAYSIDAAIEVVGAAGLIRPGLTVCGKRWGSQS